MLKFESRVTLGNMLEILVIIASVIIAYEKSIAEQIMMQKEIAELKLRADHFITRVEDEQRRMYDNERWDEIKRRLVRIENKIDR